MLSLSAKFWKRSLKEAMARIVQSPLPGQILQPAQIYVRWSLQIGEPPRIITKSSFPQVKKRLRSEQIKFFDQTIDRILISQSKILGRPSPVWWIEFSDCLQGWKHDLQQQEPTQVLNI